MCIFRPFSVLKRHVHWSHFKVFIAGAEAGVDNLVPGFESEFLLWIHSTGAWKSNNGQLVIGRKYWWKWLICPPSTLYLCVEYCSFQRPMVEILSLLLFLILSLHSFEMRIWPFPEPFWVKLKGAPYPFLSLLVTSRLDCPLLLCPKDYGYQVTLNAITS